MRSRRDLPLRVRERAEGRCEYCRMHQSLQGATFHLEHIIPQSRGGRYQLNNLAWACPSCNLHKANLIEGIDPATGDLVPLFNPRTNRWDAHFRWGDYHVNGCTPVGRATVATLDLNYPRRLLIRQAEAAFALFPPPEIET